MRRVYLDNNATTRTDPEVVAKMLPFFSQEFGNASSSHGFGVEVSAAVREARRSVQTLLGAAHDHEIVFTSGGTESDNAAILAGLAAQEGRDEIVTTAVEHPAILSLVEHLQKTRGVTAHLIGVDTRGRIDLDAFRAALGPKTAIVSAMWANNETGTLFPVAELARLAHEAGALFHTDAVQAVGKVPIDLKATLIDFLSLSAHKLHGPKGIGALYVRKGTKFAPFIRGGHQERARRGGTENTTGIVGLGAAAELARSRLQDDAVHIAALRDRLERGLIAADRPVSGLRRRRQSACQHVQHRLLRHRGRSDPDPFGSRRHRRLDRLRLHGGIDRAFACATRDERAGRSFAWRDTVLLLERKHDRGGRRCAGDAARHRRQAEGNCAGVAPYGSAAAHELAWARWPRQRS